MKNPQVDIEKCRDFLLTPEDKKRLQRICNKIRREWASPTRRAYPYTPHDDSHCERVEEKLYQLISIEKAKENLPPEEIFLLLASVWLHDIGMKPHLFNDDKSENELRDKASTIRWDRYVRENHAERSARFVKENGRRLGLTDDEIRHMIKMCRLHRHRAYKELYLEPWPTKKEPRIRIQLLIAYLRLADVLHIPHKAETGEFKIYLALGLDPISRFHWFKSKYTDSIFVSPEEFRITITLKIPESREYPNRWEQKLEPLKEVLTREVQDELESIKDILSKGGLSVYLTLECDSVEDPMMSKNDVQQLEELLNNIELFDPVLTPNASSVIATVLKQTELFLDPSDPGKSVGYLEDYKTNVLDDILEKRPCHVFLWKVSDMLKEKLQDTSISDEERIRVIQKIVDGWEVKREEAMKEIPKIAYGILADGFPILLYGYSDTIVKCLEHYLKEKKRDIEVYICEGRTKTTYRYNNRLVYCDGIKYAEELKRVQKKVNEDLKKEGIKEMSKIKIQCVTDSCASNLFSRGRISKVLFGANGIGLGGRVSHTLGHLAIADMASVYRIPVYVIADSMKIGYLQERPDLPRGNQWLTTDIRFEPKIDELENYNPREDVVPPDRIQTIVTEKGQIKPTEIARYAENIGTR